MQELWTIGHSTHPLSEFLPLLAAHGIRLIVDVRRYPHSRRNPGFNTETLPRHLSEAGVAYHHVPGLGGRRSPKPDSINIGWRNAGFRGYADYMSSAEFGMALGELMRLASSSPTAIMCAEAVPWRCHRSLIADALVARGWTVRHIFSDARANPHTLPDFARLDHGAVSYPGRSADQPSLF